MTHLDIAFLDRFANEIGPVGKSLGMLIRPAFIAAPGKTLVWGDWSAIEARVLPWLAASSGAEKVLDIFRQNDSDPDLPDIYELTAAELLGIAAAEVTKQQRQSHGKVPVLSLGFGGGVGALQKMAVNYKVYFDEAAAKALVESWRARNAWAPDFWGKFQTNRQTGEIERSSGLWGAVNMALRNPGVAYPAGRVAYVFDESYMGGTLFCALPCGRLLTYPDCKLRTREVKDADTGEVTEKTAIWYRKGYGWSALWHGKCLAADTLVLTARGWVPIVDVQPWDLLWDGEEWVAHDGLRYQGDKNTMPVDGVWMTPDHEVLTDVGWVKAQDTEGLNRAAVWLPDGAEAGATAGAWQQRQVVGAMRLRGREAGGEQRLAASEPEAVADVVRVQEGRDYVSAEPHARHVETPSVRGVAFDARSVPAADASGVAQLRRAGYHRVREVAGSVPELLGGHGVYVPDGAAAGAAGQRGWVQPGELRLGDAGRPSTEPTQQHMDRHSLGVADSSRCVASERREGEHDPLPVGAQLPAGAPVRGAGVYEPVYDLMNAGPRQRFTVLGETGAVIVHNCAENITQAVAGSILRETLVELDMRPPARAEIVGHTHDEIVLECDDDAGWITDATSRLEFAMGHWRPEWRETLPLTAEVTEAPFYTKANG